MNFIVQFSISELIMKENSSFSFSSKILFKKWFKAQISFTSSICGIKIAAQGVVEKCFWFFTTRKHWIDCIVKIMSKFMFIQVNKV